MRKSFLPRIYDAWLFAIGAMIGSMVLGFSWKISVALLFLAAILYGWADVYDPTKRPADHFLSDYDLETLPEHELLSMGVSQEKIDIAKGRISKSDR